MRYLLSPMSFVVVVVVHNHFFPMEHCVREYFIYIYALKKRKREKICRTYLAKCPRIANRTDAFKSADHVHAFTAIATRRYGAFINVSFTIASCNQTIESHSEQKKNMNKMRHIDIILLLCRYLYVRRRKNINASNQNAFQIVHIYVSAFCHHCHIVVE